MVHITKVSYSAEEDREAITGVDNAMSYPGFQHILTWTGLYPRAYRNILHRFLL